MGILKRIFGRPEDASKVIDGAVKGLDAIFFTKEEKAHANQKLSDWYLKYLAATQSQNVARRFIAMVVVLLWAALIITGIMARVAESWLEVKATEGHELISEFIFRVMVEVVATPFSVIIGFYFLTHAVRAYQNGGKK